MLRRILPTVLLVFAVIPLLGQTTPEQRLQNEVKQSPFHALVIGIGDYKFLPKLVTATNDATTIAAVLRKQYGFKVKLLLNSSREQVLDGLDECRSLPENSSLVIYFAGHTISDRDMERAYWLPVDAAPNHRAQWILTDEVIAMIRASRARHIVVFTDTPFSSEPMLRSGDGFGADKLSVEYLTTVWHRRSRSFLSGYNRDERVPDGPGKLSAFASAVLDGLTTIDKQLFTVAELFNRIVERNGLSPSFGFPRNAGDEGGEFLFLRRSDRKAAAQRSTGLLLPASFLYPRERAPSGTSGISDESWYQTPAVSAPPGNADASVHLNRGVALLIQGEFNEAIAEYNEALRLNPADATAHYHLAWIYARAPDASYRNPTLALEHAQKAMELTHGGANELGALADALYVNGKTQDAINMAEKALKLDPASNDLRTQLERYRAGPYQPVGGADHGPSRGVQVVGGGTASDMGTTQFYALIIGINRYPNWPADKQLTTAESDAKSVAQMLVETYTFPKENVTLILGSSNPSCKPMCSATATRENILNSLDNYSNLPNDASLLIYFAGHGDKVQATEEAYWLPLDSSPGKTANRINAHDVTLAIKASKARHVLIVADSCYAGGMVRFVDMLTPPKPDDTPEGRQGRLNLLKKRASAGSRTLLSSGGDHPVADTGGHDGHSVFASAFLDSLREMEASVFDAAELFHFKIDYKLAIHSSVQTAQYVPIQGAMPGDQRADEGDFIFIRRTP